MTRDDSLFWGCGGGGENECAVGGTNTGSRDPGKEWSFDTGLCSPRISKTNAVQEYFSSRKYSDIVDVSVSV